MMSKLLFRSICRAIRIMLEMETQSACRVVMNYNNYGNDIVHQKQNEYQVLLLRLTNQMVRNNDIHFVYGNNFRILFRLVCQIMRNSMSFIDYEGDYGNNSNATYDFTIIFESVYQTMNQIHVSCKILYYWRQRLLFIVII